MKIQLAEPVDLDTLAPDAVLTDVDGTEWGYAGGMWCLIESSDD